VTVAPDFAEPIVAWRSWRVLRSADGPRLASVVRPTVWEPRRELVGECLTQRRRVWVFGRRTPTVHDAPDLGCGCGIYATEDAALAGLYVSVAEPEHRHVPTRVIGLVSLWGRVLACTRGWRGELAYPARIYVPMPADDPDSSPFEELAFSLADYGVPIEIVSYRGRRDIVRSIAALRTASPARGGPID
jgi:hypothetical protein